MAQDKIQMPQSSGGILRYDTEVGSKIKLSPTTVVVFISIIIVLALLLETKGFGLF